MRKHPVIFKALLLVLACCCAIFVKAQEPCEISCNVEMPVCSGAAVTLSIPNNYQYSFLWSPGGQTNNSITVRPLETTTYQVEVGEPASGDLVCR